MWWQLAPRKPRGQNRRGPLWHGPVQFVILHPKSDSRPLRWPGSFLLFYHAPMPSAHSFLSSCLSHRRFHPFAPSLRSLFPILSSFSLFLFFLFDLLRIRVVRLVPTPHILHQPRNTFSAHRCCRWSVSAHLGPTWKLINLLRIADRFPPSLTVAPAWLPWKWSAI